ncbi:MAG TPA: hypothetical protein DD733_07815 [Clostridiales bacterium]|nr:hypothetical protein [Clostridiales bacterium]
MVNYGLLSLFMGSSTVDGYLAVENSVLKSIMGIPTNIFLIIEMIILYKVLPKKLLKGGFNGRDSQKFS